MRKIQFLGVAFASACLPIAAQAITIRDSVGIAGAAAYGAQSQFAAVGQVNGASGVLISNQWVLTAWHVVNSATPGDISFRVNGSDRAISEIRLLAPANASFSTVAINGTDLALLRLTDVVNDVNPASLYLGTNELNRLVSVAGYGNIGTGSGGVTGGSNGVRHAMRNTVDFYANDNGGGNIGFVTGRRGVFMTDFDGGQVNWMGSADMLDLEGGVAGGDSGGGLFIEENGQFLLAGINSWVGGTGSPAFGFGEVNGYVNVSWNQQWIQDTLAVPEPGTMIALTGLVALLARKRIKK
jgi:hypothetical protein